MKINKDKGKEISLEIFEEDEILFIKNKYERDSKTYLQAMNVLLVISVMAPTFFIIMQVLVYKKSFYDVHLITVFIVVFLAILLLVAVVAVILYLQKIYPLYLDTKHKNKIIEPCLILRKKAILENSSFHFFLDSKIKLSIEVLEHDYSKYEIGDEINIEYAQYSKEYFDYF